MPGLAGTQGLCDAGDAHASAHASVLTKDAILSTLYNGIIWFLKVLISFEKTFKLKNLRLGNFNCV